MRIQAREDEWYFEDGKYYREGYDGWCVFSNSFEWQIKNPEGVYAACYKTLAKAMAFAERKMSLPKCQKGE